MVEPHCGFVGVEISNLLGSTTLLSERSVHERCRAEAPRTGATPSEISHERSDLRLGEPDGGLCFSSTSISFNKSKISPCSIPRVAEDLRARVAGHNVGEFPHTANFRPWRIKSAIAFSDELRAPGLEKYLISASGRAFAKKRLFFNSRSRRCFYFDSPLPRARGLVIPARNLSNPKPHNEPCALGLLSGVLSFLPHPLSLGGGIF